MFMDETNRTVRQILDIVNDSNVESEAVVLLQSSKSLRNDCARGSHLQEFITTHTELNDFIHALLFANIFDLCPEQHGQLYSMALQLLANAVVNNSTTQKLVWSRHGQYIIKNCENTPLSRNTDIQLMILYNIFRGSTGVLSEEKAFSTILRIWEKLVEEKCNINMEFLHFFYEHFLVKEGRTTVRCYARLKPNERIVFLDYLSNYLRHDSPNGVVNSFLLRHISKEFKVKSDCILRQSTAPGLDTLNPREAYSLLRIIACATGSEVYSPTYTSDHSLFLNVSSVLRCLVAVGKEPTGNIFVPMNKLEEVALSSNISYDFESDISFELKTLLVRCIANLLYKNKTNKNFCLDTDLMPALFDCTNMDARNPYKSILFEFYVVIILFKFSNIYFAVIKEWSILAIRNACEDCKEIQEIVENLQKRGDVENDIIGELNLEMGSLRITPSR